MKKKELEHIIEGFESTSEILQIRVHKLEQEIETMLGLISDVRSAIKVEGKRPKRHKKIMFHHRVEWPYLWERIDKLVKFYEEKNKR